jgi:hypothetical protein
MNNDNDKSQGWLQGEIKKRKTQEIDAQILKRKTGEIQRVTGSVPTVPDVKRQTGEIKRTTGSGTAVRPPDVQRSTREVPAVSPEVRRSTREMSVRPLEAAPPRPAASSSINTVKRSTGTTSSIAPTAEAIGQTLTKNKRVIVGALVGTVVLALCLGLTLIIPTGLNSAQSMTITTTPGVVEYDNLQPTIASLPTFSADQVVSYLMVNGLPVLTQSYPKVPNNSWRAAKEIVLTVGQDPSTANILQVFSYAKPSQIGADMIFKNAKDWRQRLACISGIEYFSHW